MTTDFDVHDPVFKAAAEAIANDPGIQRAAFEAATPEEFAAAVDIDEVFEAFIAATTAKWRSGVVTIITHGPTRGAAVDAACIAVRRRIEKGASDD